MRLPRTFSQKSRKVFYFIHLWTGLLLGLWLVMMGLTGSILSWKTELNEWQARRRVAAVAPKPNDKIIPVSQAIAALKAANPELKPERGLTLPVRPSGYYMHHARGEINGERVTQLYLIDPVTAKVYPPVIEGTLLAEITEQIHHNLLLGVKGTVTNGFFTFFTLFMLASGAWLWWPSTLKQFKQRIWLKRTVSIRRTLFDLHNMMGVYFFGLLFLVTLTGVIICYNGQTDQSISKGINRFAGVKEIPRVRDGEGGARGGEGRGRGERGRDGAARGMMGGVQGQGSEGRGGDDAREPLPIDELVEKARAALPNNPLVSIRMPRRPGQPFMATYELARLTSGGVPFDPYTGERLTTGDEAAFGRPPTPGARTMGAVFHLHYGWFGGNWTKVLYCLSGFVPLGLFITGVWMWGRKKKSELQKKNKAKLKNQTPRFSSGKMPDAKLKETAKVQTETPAQAAAPVQPEVSVQAESKEREEEPVPV